MKEFLNEEKKQLGDCTGEEMKCVFTAENLQVLDIEEQEWVKKDLSWFQKTCIYRTTPEAKRMPDYPWHVLSDDIKYCAIDDDGDVYAYRDLPSAKHGRWMDESQCPYELPQCLKFDRGNVDWQDSLQMRPVQPTIPESNPEPDQFERWEPKGGASDEDVTDIALDIQTKNNQELFFVGYTNGAQVLYASEGEGLFYSNTENECYIPLYMLKTHEHRLNGKFTSGLNFETILKERETVDWQDSLQMRPNAEPVPVAERWEPKGGEWYVDCDGDTVQAESLDTYQLFGVEFEKKAQAEQAAKDFRLLHLMYRAWREVEGWGVDSPEFTRYLDPSFSISSHSERWEAMIAPWVEELK